jgi:hypothetical protein
VATPSRNFNNSTCARPTSVARRRFALRALVAPSIASLAIHAALGVFIGTVAIGKYMRMGEQDTHGPLPIEIVVDFDQPNPQQSGLRTAPELERDRTPQRALEHFSKPPPEERSSSMSFRSSSPNQTQAHEQSHAATSARATTDHVEGTLDKRIAERLSQVNSQDQGRTEPGSEGNEALEGAIRSRLGRPGGNPSATGGSGIAPSTSFAGLRASNAQSIVYVVDASGSLIGTLPVVRRELEQSLRRLDPSQRFSVVFFQRNQALEAPVPEGTKASSGGLRKATPAAVEHALAWAGAIRPLAQT